MMRKWLGVVVLGVVMAGAGWLSRGETRGQVPIGAPVEVVDYSRIHVVSYASGLTGFFDTHTGVLYIYDGACSRCVMIRKITTLGEPMEILREPKLH